MTAPTPEHERAREIVDRFLDEWMNGSIVLEAEDVEELERRIAAALAESPRERALWDLEHKAAPTNDLHGAYWWGRGVNDAVAAIRAAALAESPSVAQRALSDDALSDAIAKVTRAYRWHFSSGAICDEVHGAIFREVRAALATAAPPEEPA